jgi:hypothetical protein
MTFEENLLTWSRSDDNLPEGVRAAHGSVEEMIAAFEDFDPV